MGNAKATPKTKKPRAPKPNTLLKYILEYIGAHEELVGNDPIDNLIDTLKDDIVTESLKGA